MRFADVIARKRDGQALTRPEIDLFVRGVVDGSVPDYQAAALLMAIVLRGMTGEPLLAEFQQEDRMGSWR
jgi:thymidine phosphorylase